MLSHLHLLSGICGFGSDVDSEVLNRFGGGRCRGKSEVLHVDHLGLPRVPDFPFRMAVGHVQ